MLLLAALVLAGAAQAVASSADCTSALGRFRAALAEVRAGNEEQRAELVASASELCDACARCDASDVAAYYLALTPEQRAAGLALEQRVSALRTEVQRAAAAGLAGEDWSVLRERVLGELDALVFTASEAPDFAPAAQAASLAARIAIERLERDRALAHAERERIAARTSALARQSRELFARAGQLTPRLEPAWVTARLARLAGNRDGARTAYEALERDAQRVARPEYREYALRGLAQLARDAGDRLEEERLLLAIASFRSPRDSWILARDWGSFLLNGDHVQEAVEFLERFAPPATDATGARAEWDTLLGAALLRNGDTRGAREHFERLAADRGGELAVLGLASLALREQRAFEVLALLDGSRTEGFTALGQAQARAMRGEALALQGDWEAAEVELEAALDVADSWQAQLGEETALGPVERTARNVIGEWLGVHTVAWLARARMELDRPIDAAAAIEEYQSRSLRGGSSELARLRRIAGLGADAPALASDDLRAWAAHAELGLVTWAIGPDFGVVAHVARDGSAECALVALSRAEVEEGARRLREAAIAGDASALARLEREIGTALFPTPIAERLEHASALAGSAGRLLALLHGALEALPIELARIGDQELGLTAALCCLPGLPALEPGAESGLPAAWRFLGAPSESGKSELGEARAELEELARSRSLAPLVGRAFDRASLRAALASDSALHVATHLAAADVGERGRFEPFGFLVSGGDVLSAAEVRALAPSLPLAVLSSCASSGSRLLDAEGLQGLARAFLESGTRNVVATLWPVEDRAARAFAIELHARLDAGLSPSRAVREARESLRRSGYPPADWAAFRALGRD